MDRRSFFKSALNKSSKTVVKAVDTRVRKQATRWIRPPFAINELEFMLACTRCGDCITACPHDVIFGLATRLGVKFAATPALDLLNKGCHLCSDWPCVNACEAGALSLPEITEPVPDEPGSETAVIPQPVLAHAAIDQHSCLPYSGPECGACISSCPVPGALTLNGSKPLINDTICTGCGLCRETCITEPKAILITSLYAQ